MLYYLLEWMIRVLPDLFCWIGAGNLWKVPEVPFQVGAGLRHLGGVLSCKDILSALRQMNVTDYFSRELAWGVMSAHAWGAPRQPREDGCRERTGLVETASHAIGKAHLHHLWRKDTAVSSTLLGTSSLIELIEEQEAPGYASFTEVMWGWGMLEGLKPARARDSLIISLMTG